jgi:hypothetical protein
MRTNKKLLAMAEAVRAYRSACQAFGLWSANPLPGPSTVAQRRVKGLDVTGIHVA